MRTVGGEPMGAMPAFLTGEGVLRGCVMSGSWRVPGKAGGCIGCG